MRQATVTTLAEDSPSLLGRGLGGGALGHADPAPQPPPQRGGGVK
jgi:hypothetical protein